MTSTLLYKKRKGISEYIGEKTSPVEYNNFLKYPFNT